MSTDTVCVFRKSLLIASFLLGLLLCFSVPQFTSSSFITNLSTSTGDVTRRGIINGHQATLPERTFSCSSLGLKTVAACLNKEGLVHSHAEGSACRINVTFLNYSSPVSHRLDIIPENTSFVFDLCRKCRELIPRKSLIVTKELISGLLQDKAFVAQNFPQILPDQNLTIKSKRKLKFSEAERELGLSFLKDVLRLSPSGENHLPHLQRNQRGKYFSRCAIVGNSANLLNRTQGPLIDSHDAVFRFNEAPVSGFESDVGSRTTVRVFNDHRAVSLYHDNDEEIFVFTRFLHTGASATKIEWRSIIENWRPLFNNLEEKKPKNPFVFYAAMKVIGSGEMAIQLATQWCEKISIFGFTYERFERYTHYFPDPFRHTGHSPVRDRAELLALNCTGILYLPNYLNE